jgi:hypothetical protein
METDMDWLLSVWQWVGGFSRLEWIVIGIVLITLVLDVGEAMRLGTLHQELVRIRKLLEQKHHDG